MPKKTTKTEYTATLNLGGKKYTEKGASPMECLEKISVRNAKGRAILSVTHGDSSKDRILTTVQVSRLLSGHGLMREIALKQTASLFDGI